MLMEARLKPLKKTFRVPSPRSNAASPKAPEDRVVSEGVCGPFFVVEVGDWACVFLFLSLRSDVFFFASRYFQVEG